MAVEVLLNGNTIELTSTVGSLSVERIDPGFDTEKVKFSLSGRVRNNTPTSIGELKVSAASSKYIHKSPTLSQVTGLQFDSRLRAKLKNQTKNTRGKITTYVYDLIYTAKEDVLITNPLSYKFKNETKADVTTKQTGISRVLVNTDTIHPFGERRKIIIYGTPRTEFQISVTKITDFKDSGDRILNSTEESILRNSNATLELESGQVIDIVKGNIDSTGKKIIMQKFPKIDASHGTTRYGINLYAKGQDFTKEFENKGGNQWIIENPWNDWYRKIITQQPGISVQFRALTDESAGNVTLQINEGAVAAFDSGAAKTKTYRGTHKSTKGFRENSIYIKYTYKALSGTFAVRSGTGGTHSYTGTTGVASNSNNALGNPVFSHKVDTDSDWTNTVTKDNGGLYMNMYNIKTVLSDSNKTATISFYVDIYNWGTKNNICDLDIHNIVARS